MVVKQLELQVAAQDDVVMVRHATRNLAVETGLNLVDQTKIVTAASELARNTIIHGGGGSATLELIDEGVRMGLRLTFADQGPGIADLDKAMSDGFTTAGGMGLGLGGSKRLCSEFSIKSNPGEGTRVTIACWKGKKGR